MQAAGVSVVEGVEAATLHPAELLGITDRKGTLEPGTDADFVMLGDVGETLGSITVLKTFIAGECVYDSLRGP